VCAFSVTSRVTQRDARTGCERSGQRRPPTSRRTEPQPAGPNPDTGQGRRRHRGILAARLLRRDPRSASPPCGHGPVRHARRTQYRRHGDQGRPCPRSDEYGLKRDCGIVSYRHRDVLQGCSYRSARCRIGMSEMPSGPGGQTSLLRLQTPGLRQDKFAANRLI